MFVFMLFYLLPSYNHILQIQHSSKAPCESTEHIFQCFHFKFSTVVVRIQDVWRILNFLCCVLCILCIPDLKNVYFNLGRCYCLICMQHLQNRSEYQESWISRHVYVLVVQCRGNIQAIQTIQTTIQQKCLPCLTRSTTTTTAKTAKTTTKHGKALQTVCHGLLWGQGIWSGV
jgi:hypothetical protein